MEQKQTKRRWLSVVAWLAVALAVLTGTAVLLNWNFSRPFRTTNRFVDHLRDERFDEARAMIDPADRDKIPADYWEQFRGYPLESGVSPTQLTFFNGRMAMKVLRRTPDGYGQRIDIRYEVSGERIRVAEVSGRMPD